MEHSFLWLVMLVALVGAAFNAKAIRWGFLIWALTDGFWCCYDLVVSNYPRAILQAFYVVIDLYGFFWWQKIRVNQYFGGSRGHERENHTRVRE